MHFLPVIESEVQATTKKERAKEEEEEEEEEEVTSRCFLCFDHLTSIGFLFSTIFTFSTTIPSPSPSSTYCVLNVTHWHLHG